MKLSFTEPVCSGGAVLPPPRGHSQLRFLMKVSLVYISMMIATLQLLANSGKGQNLDQLKVTTELNHESLSVLFQQIQRQTNLTFAFIPNEISPYNNVTIPKGTRSVKATLELAFRETGLEYEQVDSNVIISVGAAAVVSETSASLIQGTVKDDEGQVMPGVNIVVKGTTSGTTTDSEGRFVIDARPSDVLVFSFIGYKPQEVEVGSRSAIDIVMESDVEALKEVVVNAGYYQTTDKMKTGSIVRVAAKDIETQPVTSPLMALQGRMPGVDVTPQNGVPGSAFKILVRGQNSLRAGGGNTVNGNLPLYVIDGIPVDSRPMLAASENLVGDGFDPLSTISPANIESIEVLKDADATAIYGSRGANGVVLITTKRGSKSERTAVDVNFYKGIGQVANRLDMMNTQQYLQMRREAFVNDNAKPGSSFFTPDYDILRWDTTRYTDWQKVFIGGTAQIADVQSSISGGSARTSFRIGGGYHKETLVFPGDFNYRRVNGFISLNHLSLDKRFSAMLSLTYGSERNQLLDGLNVINNALNLAPDAPRLYDDLGNLNWEGSTWTNPMAAFRNTHKVNTDNMVSNIVLGYEIIPRLILKSNFGYTKIDSDELMKFPISAYNPSQTYRTGAVRNGGNNRKSWIIEPQLTYNARFGDGELNAVVGTTWQESDYKSQLITAGGFTSDVLLGNIRAGNTLTFVRDDKSKYRYTALFGRLGYTWKDRYLLNLTGRRDGSSRFGPNRRFANFGAIGAGWIFSNENFIKDGVSFLSFGKFRGSYGSTGNDQIGDYQFYNTYGLTPGRYQDAVSLTPTSLYNPDYAWEVTRKLEFALEFSILDNRISSEVSWYRNRSSNQLVDYSLPYTTGFQSVGSNFGALIQNTGWEIQLRLDNIRSDKFRWSTAFNVTLPKNKLVKYPGIEDSPYAYMYIVGQPLSAIKLYTLKGVNPQTGVYEVHDVDDSGTISSDVDNTYVQNLAREYYGGMVNTVSYKSFELSFLFQFSKQEAQSYNFVMPGQQGNQPVYVLDHWRREGGISDVQKFSQDTSGEPMERYSWFRGSNGMIENASFIRLKTATLYYDLPSVLRDKAKFQNVRIYVQGQNLITFTKYRGLDPETQGALPPLRMILAGLQIKI